MKNVLWSILIASSITGVLFLIVNRNKWFFNKNRPGDRYATPECLSLYKRLQKVVTQKKYLLGHQEDLAYGVQWKFEEGRSDVKDIAGNYPALYGWDIAGIELMDEVNIDSVPFSKIKTYIQQAHERGGIATVSWHIQNPLTENNAWDTTLDAVSAILPGGRKHDRYVEYLNRVADFFASLRDDQGHLIPVLFRPFHELTGSWFWWGKKHHATGELQSLFRFTVQFLQKKKHLHNLLIVYNTSDDFSNEEEYLAEYPGDNYVDLLSFDTYQKDGPAYCDQFASALDRQLRLLCRIAQKHHKMAAIGEMGYNEIPYPYWFTRIIAPVLRKYPIAYTLFWRNAGYNAQENKYEYYIPYTTHPAAADFKTYVHLPEVLLED